MGKTTSAVVTPEVLKWARNLDCITAEDAAAHMHVKTERLESWEDGTTLPTLHQAKELSKYYRVPFVYFFLPDIPRRTKRLDKADFRTFGNIGEQIAMSRELRWLLRDIEDRRDSMIELYTMQGREPIPFSCYISNLSTAKRVAEQLRAFLGLNQSLQEKFRKPEKALAYCVERLEMNDVLIFQAAKIDPHEMRGLSVGYDVFPIIVLNRKDEYAARLFTLIHELTHIALRNTGICNDSSLDGLGATEVELFCNKVAGLVLVPDSDLLECDATKWIAAHGIEDIYVSAIARDFAVSKEVIINRLCATRIITKKVYLETLTRYTDEYKRYAQKKPKGMVPPALDKGTQVGRLYTKTVLSAYHNDLITVRDTSAYLLNLNAKHFHSIERWCL